MKPVDYDAKRRYRIYQCIDRNSGAWLSDSLGLRVLNALSAAEGEFHPTFTTSDSALPKDQPFHNGGIDHFVAIGTQDPAGDLDAIEAAFGKAAAAASVEVVRVFEGTWSFHDAKWEAWKNLREVN